MRSDQAWWERRKRTRTHYPDLGPRSLAEALTSALEGLGSRLSALPSDPDAPRWSPFTDHPEAPGETVPEAVRVRVEGRTCQVWIGSPMFALGEYGLDFHAGGGLVGTDGTVVVQDLGAAATIIKRAFDDDENVADVTAELGVAFMLPAPVPEDSGMPASVARMMANIYSKLERLERGNPGAVRRYELIRDHLEEEGRPTDADGPAPDRTP